MFEMNGTHQLMACVSVVSVVGKNVNIVKKITESLFVVSKEF